MADIPQPASERYDNGDLVRVYIAPDDPDVKFHNERCRVVDVIEDELDSETGRELDQFSYRLKCLETGDVLPVAFRHEDLVPDQ